MERSTLSHAFVYHVQPYVITVFIYLWNFCSFLQVEPVTSNCYTYIIHAINVLAVSYFLIKLHQFAPSLEDVVCFVTQ